MCDDTVKLIKAPPKGNNHKRKRISVRRFGRKWPVLLTFLPTKLIEFFIQARYEFAIDVDGRLVKII